MHFIFNNTRCTIIMTVFCKSRHCPFFRSSHSFTISHFHYHCYLSTLLLNVHSFKDFLFLICQVWQHLKTATPSWNWLCSSALRNGKTLCRSTRVLLSSSSLTREGKTFITARTRANKTKSNSSRFPSWKCFLAFTQIAISRYEGSHSKSRKRGRVYFKQDESGWRAETCWLWGTAFLLSQFYFIVNRSNQFLLPEGSRASFLIP